ncbi:unnamed protein product [Victoria cruziana]
MALARGYGEEDSTE